MHIEDFPEQEIGTRRVAHLIPPFSEIHHALLDTSEIDVHTTADIRLTTYRGKIVLTQLYLNEGNVFRILLNAGDVVKLENVDSKHAEVTVNERFYVTKPRIKLSFSD